MRDPSEITVLDIVHLLDGEVAPEHDPGKEEASTVWRNAVAALHDVLGNTTVADVVQQEAQAGRGADVLHIEGRSCTCP